MIDLRPACTATARVVTAVPDDALDRPTPCAEYSVGDLLDHLGGAAVAFRAAALKAPLDGAVAGDGSRLGPGWRERIVADLAALAAAWDDPAAWEGMTAAGGVDLPGEVAALVALDEVVLHGWDLAKALGLPAGYDGPGLEAMHANVVEFRAAGIEGLFGPEVPVPDGASLFDRILGTAGRDPNWSPPAP